MTEKRLMVAALRFTEDGRELARGTVVWEGETPRSGAMLLGRLTHGRGLSVREKARWNGEEGFTAVLAGERFLLGREEAAGKSWFQRLLALGS